MLEFVVGFFVSLTMIIGIILGAIGFIFLFLKTVDKIGDWTGWPDDDKMVIAVMLFAILALAVILTKPAQRWVYRAETAPSKVAIEAE